MEKVHDEIALLACTKGRHSSSSDRENISDDDEIGLPLAAIAPKKKRDEKKKKKSVPSECEERRREKCEK